MKLEQQVCSLELAKRLKELKVKQDSFFYWIKQNKDSNQYCLVNENNFDKSYLISAFTVAELGEMLPWGNLGFRDKHGTWVQTDTTEPVRSVQRDEIEANVRAKMLIYLLENKLIEVPE